MQKGWQLLQNWKSNSKKAQNCAIFGERILFSSTLAAFILFIFKLTLSFLLMVENNCIMEEGRRHRYTIETCNLIWPLLAISIGGNNLQKYINYKLYVKQIEMQARKCDQEVIILFLTLLPNLFYHPLSSN